jgi:hypothetical protein
MAYKGVLKAAFTAGVLTLGLVAAQSAAFAMTYQFTVDGSGGTLGSGPWGTVDVTQSGTTLSFDVELAPNQFLNTGGSAHHSFTFNLSNTLGTIANIVSDAVSGSMVALNPAAGPFDNKLFTGFNYAIDCTDTKGSADCGSSLKFDVMTAGMILASTGDPNIFFAADIATVVDGATKTGSVGATVVPLPPAALLFGSALAGIGLLSRRRRKRKPVVLHSP